MWENLLTQGFSLIYLTQSFLKSVMCFLLLLVHISNKQGSSDLHFYRNELDQAFVF